MPRMRRISTRGFTLIELALITSILMAVGYLLVVSYDGMPETVEVQTAQFEIVQVKKALLRFYRDTGFLPGTGPFDLEANGGAVRASDLPKFELQGQADAWLHSPANFWQLFENPLPPEPIEDVVFEVGGIAVSEDGTVAERHPLGAWNPTTRRGWNGPYLESSGNGLVRIGSNLQENGDGDPAAGAPLPFMFGVADPFIWEPTATDLLCWTDIEKLLDDNPDNDEECRDRWGRPYFLFGLDRSNPRSPNSQTRIVSSGPNGRYDSHVLADENPHNDHEIGDDLVVYLFR